MENGNRTVNALRKYSDALGLEPYQEEDDRRAYDMSERLKLADIVAKDGKKKVVDLGSQAGGMSHALKGAGVEKVVSTEHIRQFCTKYIRHVNDDVVLCDSFRLPIRNADALVSYMFLGQALLGQPGKNRGMAEVFDEFSRSAGTVYSVELHSEYCEWFGAKNNMGPEELEQKLKGALPDWDVERLGEFGTYRGHPDAAEMRMGFKFTKKEEKHGKRQEG